MGWEVEYTNEFEEWWTTLDVQDQATVSRAVEELVTHGPALGRPWVDTLKGSRHRNLKELRPRGGFLRIPFAFDPRRVAILLLGGNKKGQWVEWYEEMLPVAERLYDEHLEALRQEGEPS